MFDQLYNLITTRRTPRLVETNNIPEENITKILNAAKSAPSFDKAYAYSIHALTNSPAGITKKEQLLEFYRCTNSDGTHPKYGDTFHNREMVQPILSGLVLVYVITPKRGPNMKTGPQQTINAAVRDSTISATYAMLAAASLGYKTGMLCAIDSNYHPVNNAVKLFVNDTISFISMSVTVATDIIPIPESTIPGASPHTGPKQYFNYKGMTPFVYPKKHWNVNKVPTVITV